MIDPELLLRGQVNEVAPGVWYIPALMANVYFAGDADGRWVMIDAGTPGTAWRLRTAAKEVFRDARPWAIILTHGHFDHVGALEELSREWDVPVFAHPLEFPYLDGRDQYPPPDPTVGGFMAQLSRMFPRKGVQVSERLRPLMVDGSVPYMPGWRFIHTPGHTPGHVSLFRDSDRTLIAGDAIITIDQQNPLKLFSQVREFHGPPHYFTQDWESARRSIQALVDLRPRTVATGHGLPLSGDDVPELLARFAAEFQPPAQGRYVDSPALADEQGTYYIPPRPRDAVPLYAAGVALAAMGLVYYATRTKKRPQVNTAVAVRDPYLREPYI
ncbi:MAG TPA: MBL fold metallo-hydrolase [Bryobacteraceae bacterium]|nr:MBL fold metallo-hydrolase [Bryobacteraceae bacterium]